MTTVVTHQKRVPTKTCPMTPIPMKTSFWGLSLMSLFPGDIPMTLLLSSSPWEKTTHE